MNRGERVAPAEPFTRQARATDQKGDRMAGSTYIELPIVNEGELLFSPAIPPKHEAAFRRIPLRAAAPRPDLYAFSGPFVGDLVPSYYGDGRLWFVFDLKGKPSERYEPIEPSRFAGMSWLQIQHALADESATTRRCYFIGGDEGLIKIGYSYSPEERLKALQLGSPIELRILATAPGGAARERAYHDQFAAMRVRGEWFERAPEIEAEIARLQGEAA